MYHKLLVLICAIAAINWGLVTGLGINAVEVVTPEMTVVRQLREPLYILIGLAGVVVLLQQVGVLKSD